MNVEPQPRTSSPPLAPPAVTDELCRAVADEADVHLQSVARRLAGLPVRGRSGRRIDAALARRGLVPSPAVRAAEGHRS
ncbi:MAG TPA: hypothetical protein VHS09_15600 [Polyangiaceae bacterium]|jgi:hypothetical protein|nr:hypothetical protein [Polyangiaceae bacterium]